jgi:hypothetical protein
LIAQLDCLPGQGLHAMHVVRLNGTAGAGSAYKQHGGAKLNFQTAQLLVLISFQKNINC